MSIQRAISRPGPDSGRGAYRVGARRRRGRYQRVSGHDLDKTRSVEQVTPCAVQPSTGPPTLGGPHPPNLVRALHLARVPSTTEGTALPWRYHRPMSPRREYGPHRPEDAPDLPARLARQRVQINTRAAGGGRGGLCRICGRDEDACRWTRPGPDPHVYEPSRP